AAIYISPHDITSDEDHAFSVATNSFTEILVLIMTSKRTLILAKH
ncbi:5460_t:CDS:1, partial [Gigaspora rosea]